MSKSPIEKTTPKEEAKGKSLDILFPKTIVDLGNGVKLDMFPVPISDLASVMDSFLKITMCKIAGNSDAEIAVVCMKEILVLLPYSTDFPLEKISHYYFPEILEAFLDLNMTEDLVKKWTALVERVECVTGQSNLKR